MKMIKNMVNLKINMITADDLLKYGGQFNISISRSEAEKIAKYLRGKNFDIFDDRDRTTIIKEVAKIAGRDKAMELNKLFIQFTS